MKLIALYLAGGVQLAILAASASVPRVFDWRKNLRGLDPFLRKLFWVYGVFIVMVIIAFGVLTLRHAPVMAAGDPLARWVCGVIAIFWAARLLVQWFVFDAERFLTRWWLRAGYHALTVAFFYLIAVYSWAAWFPLVGKEAL